MTLYNPDGFQPLFQCRTAMLPVITDSRVRKALSINNEHMGLPHNYYTIHAFRHSSPSFAYQAFV